jgi:hypothetical protein
MEKAGTNEMLRTNAAVAIREHAAMSGSVLLRRVWRLKDEDSCPSDEDCP